MEQLPKIVRERLQAGAKPEVHPDPDLLTAFTENALIGRERLQVFEHLSSCADCREIVSLTQPELVMEHVAAMAAVPAASAPARPVRKSPWTSRLLLSWGAVAACVVVGVALLHYQSHEKGPVQLAAKQTAPDANLGQAPATELTKAEPPTSTPPAEVQLEARLQAPPKSKVESRVDKDSAGAVPRDNPSQLVEKKFGAAGGAGSVVGGLMSRPVVKIPPSTQQVTVLDSTETAAVAAKPQEELPLQSRPNAGQVASAAFAGQAAPPAPQKENQPAATPPPANAAAATGKSLNSLSAFAGRKTSAESNEVAARQEVALARVSSNYLPSRWTISSDGTTLLRSIGEGGSWTVVSVANNVVFRAVAGIGGEVWAGGKSGALYHSTDLGMHWTQVKPTVNGVALTADVVSIDFSDAQHGKLTTSEGNVWTTTDGGKSWQTQ